MPDGTEARRSTLQRFLAAFWKDVDAGSPRPLAEYLAEFGGDDASIAREYAAVLYGGGGVRRTDASQVGPYRVLRELGRGGQGSVYLAEDSRLGRKVALKVLSGLPALSSKSTQRFKREAEITARLDHPGICTTYDFGDSDGVAWIAMRYVEGQTLSARIAAARNPGSASTSEHLSFARDGPPPDPSPETPASAWPSSGRTREEISWVVRIIEQTARALHVAHENGVIHRDIKPANIMVTQDDAPVILDFGLANAMEPGGVSLTGTGDLMGTPQYMAPEQLTRDAIPPDRRADVYSLGVTLYEALTLSRPFDAPTRERLYQAILTKDPPDPHRMNGAISRDLSAVVATAIEKDRDGRYQTALDFAEDLNRVLAHQPVLARRAGPLLRMTRWAERNPAVALSVTSSFVVLVAGLAVALILLRRTNEALAGKEKALTEFERLSDVKRLRDLTQSASTLLPPVPSNIGELSSWLKRAETVVAQLPLHRRALAELDAQASPETARLEDQWKREYLTELIRELEIFADPDHRGALADVRKRLELAQTVRRRTVEDFADRWGAAVASIADLARCPKYGGLRIPPQVGLVPVGRNSATGLWEFVDIHSGALPETDGREASFELEDSTGIVLVLMPGGVFRMGSPTGEPRRADDEGLHDARVAPFFMGKHEVTQAQWQRIMGSNPSGHRPELDPSITPLHPVESMDWNDAAQFAARINAMLPSEAEWEYACRAGSTTAFTWGDDPEVLKDRANVSDQSLDEVERSRPTVIEKAPWRDGFGRTAPVNALRSNAFGLFGLHGNVGEWCRDWDRPIPEAVVPVDGGPPPVTNAQKCWRDGSWLMPPSAARSAARHRYDPRIKVAALGFRIARLLEVGPP